MYPKIAVNCFAPSCKVILVEKHALIWEFFSIHDHNYIFIFRVPFVLFYIPFHIWKRFLIFHKRIRSTQTSLISCDISRPVIALSLVKMGKRAWLFDTRHASDIDFHEILFKFYGNARKEIWQFALILVANFHCLRMIKNKVVIDEI